MDNVDAMVRDLLAKEGLGTFAFQLETIHPDFDSTSLMKLLATVTEETRRLQSWPHQPPGRVTTAEECHRLAMEVTGSHYVEEEEKYRHLLIIGYLYGRLALPGREVQSELQKLKEATNAQVSGLKSVESEQEKAHEWMRTLARRIWAQDEKKCHRTGYVAKEIKKHLERLKKILKERGYEGAKYWPTSDKAIRKEIKEIAPEYAKKPGRPINTNNT